MGTLTMALAAALLAGSAPEKVSGEVEQRLDLRGRWEGAFQHNGVVRLARLEGGWLRVAQENTRFSLLGECEGAQGGKCRLATRYGVRSLLYKVNGDRVLMCFRDDGQEPSSFLSSGPYRLLTLRRVRPRK